MDLSDAWLGRAVLTAAGALCVVLLIWINTYPFIDEDLAIHSVIPDPKWFLLSCAICGSLFVGGLMSFTLYHVYPHL